MQALSAKQVLAGQSLTAKVRARQGSRAPLAPSPALDTPRCAWAGIQGPVSALGCAAPEMGTLLQATQAPPGRWECLMAHGQSLRALQARGRALQARAQPPPPRPAPPDRPCRCSGSRLWPPWPAPAP